MYNTAKAFCWKTPADCRAMNAKSVRQMGQGNVSACRRLDRSFEPAR
jgi:hypothetical protein